MVIFAWGSASDARPSQDAANPGAVVQSMVRMMGVIFKQASNAARLT
jgi:hypothetical protein